MVYVRFFYGGSGKAKIARIGQGITHIFGKAVNGAFTCYVAFVVFHVNFFGAETVLGTVCFISDNDNISSV
ncbi:Uncharacterised protein [Kluyvera cryocrescens]|uniref:Uncharacterized protein n=1 Tax=Kluyvera cryocrescens TaxID=580 RepID=A0A485B563_KLUCR|nr:Uncharacterised protein [Kluyvera cryocrescens]